MSDALLESLLVSQDPFAAEDIHEPRFVWDAGVHNFYLDTCNFFFFRARDVQGDPKEKILTYVDKAQIVSYYVFSLFGHFDVCLRVWAPPNKVLNLRNLIKRDSQQFLEVQEFQAQEYCFIRDGKTSSRTKPESEMRDIIFRHLPEIQYISKWQIGAEDQKLARAETVEKLRTAGLIHIARVNKQNPLTAFRFFTIIQEQPGSAKTPTIDNLLEWCADFGQSTPDVIRAAVYQGVGHCLFLITGMVSSFETLSMLNAHVRLKMATWQARTETYLTATRNGKIADRIDPSLVDIDQTIVRVAVFLCEKNEEEQQKYIQLLSTMPIDRRREVTDAYVKNETVMLNTHYEPFFRSFLAARVLPSSQSLANSLTTLLELEGLLTELWVRNWRKAGAFDLVKGAAISVNLTDFLPNQPTLKQVVDICRKLCSSNQDDYLTGSIGKGWLDSFSDDMMWQIRNDVAHGRAFKPSYLEEKWVIIAARIDSIGTLYNRVKAASEELT